MTQWVIVSCSPVTDRWRILDVLHQPMFHICDVITEWTCCSDLQVKCVCGVGATAGQTAAIHRDEAIKGAADKTAEMRGRDTVSERLFVLLSVFLRRRRPAKQISQRWHRAPSVSECVCVCVCVCVWVCVSVCERERDYGRIKMAWGSCIKIPPESTHAGWERDKDSDRARTEGGGRWGGGGGGGWLEIERGQNILLRQPEA